MTSDLYKSRQGRHYRVRVLSDNLVDGAFGDDATVIAIRADSLMIIIGDL